MWKVKVKKFLLSDMTWLEVKNALKKTDVVLLPIGSTEQHGPHLPLGTDTLIAYKIAKEVARKIEAIVAPPMPIGFSVEHLSFPGTLTVAPKIFMALIRNVCKSLIQHGFRKIIIINGHGGNKGLIEAATRELKHKTKATIVIADVYEVISEATVHKKIRIYKAAHACELETSMMLALYPEKVRTKKIQKKTLTPTGLSVLKNGVKYVWLTKELSKSGVIGDPVKATAEQGQMLFKIITSQLIIFIRKIKCQK